MIDSPKYKTKGKSNIFRSRRNIQKNKKYEILSVS